jgi:hypothetical protein
MAAEAVVWIAHARSPGERTSGDVLVIAIRTRSRSGRVATKLGRFVSTIGALRPVHVDGGSLRVRLPRQLDVEAFAGMPVIPALVTGRAWDWVAGGRLARRLGDSGSTGIAYAQRRDGGRLASEELGLDAGLALGVRSDVGARLAYDLANPGLAEVAVTTTHRRGALRGELYAIHREPSHLVPATSLFAVIGDIASQRAGSTVTWRAAPRLDVVGDVALRHVDEAALELTARTRLRLDDRGTSALGLELRRAGVGDDRWDGVRGLARLSLPRSYVLAAELELVRPVADRGRGRLWPWALAALSWHRGSWQAALAVEASASPVYEHRVDVLAQLARSWSWR